MDEKYSCPHCRQHIIIEDAPLGGSVQCPNCRKDFSLPSEPGLKRRLASPKIWLLAAALAAAFSVPFLLPRKTPSANPETTKNATGRVPTASSSVDDDVVFQGKPLRVWIDALDTSRKREGRDEARQAFKQIGSPAVPALIRILQDTRAKDHHRGNAAYALSHAGNKGGPEVQVLIASLKDEMDYVRYAAMDGLRILWIDNGVLLPIATEMLGDSYSGVRRQAAVTLGSLGPAAKESLPALQKLTEDPDPRTREAVVTAIAKVSAPPRAVVPKIAIPKLAAQLDPPQFSLANERLNAAANDFASTNVAARAKAVLVVKELGKDFMAAFIHNVVDPEVRLSERRISAEILGHVGKKDGPEVPVLVFATTDQDFGVRGKALTSLGLLQIDPQVLVPLCIRMLDDPNSGGRRRAAENLANLGAAAKEALPALQKRTNDKTRDTREAVNSALQKITEAVASEAKAGK